MSTLFPASVVSPKVDVYPLFFCVCMNNQPPHPSHSPHYLPWTAHRLASSQSTRPYEYISPLLSLSISHWLPPYSARNSGARYLGEPQGWFINSDVRLPSFFTASERSAMQQVPAAEVKESSKLSFNLPICQSVMFPASVISPKVDVYKLFLIVCTYKQSTVSLKKSRPTCLVTHRRSLANTRCH